MIHLNTFNLNQNYHYHTKESLDYKKIKGFIRNLKHIFAWLSKINLVP